VGATYDVRLGEDHCPEPRPSEQRSSRSRATTRPSHAWSSRLPARH